jgi:hypothetical protein
MTTSLIASMALVPALALSSMPHMNGHFDGKTKVDAKADASVQFSKDACKQLRQDFNLKFRTELKTWRQNHSIRSAADAKAYVQFHKDWNLKRRELLKRVWKGDCGASSSSMSTSSTTPSSMSSTSSVGTSASSVSTSSTSSSTTTSSSLSPSSTSSSSLSSGSSVSSNGVNAQLRGRGWLNLFGR